MSRTVRGSHAATWQCDARHPWRLSAQPPYPELHSRFRARDIRSHATGFPASSPVAVLSPAAHVCLQTPAGPARDSIRFLSRADEGVPFPHPAVPHAIDLEIGRHHAPGFPIATARNE